jgi:membrane protein implicated in regulation of membrane protease activity
VNQPPPSALKPPVAPREPRPAPGWNALVLAALILGALMLALQLWLLTTALDLYLAGRGEDVWQLGLASVVLFAGGILALMQTGNRRRAARPANEGIDRRRTGRG